MVNKSHLYGPVNSRRLGISLGVDIVPYKVCSFDCIYCQVGQTTSKMITRKKYFSTAKILQEIDQILSLGKKINYITLSGSGEPTLNSNIGIIIKEIKKLTHIPVAVITNSSLLCDKYVQEELMEVDVLLPSLDAVREKTFKLINQPHKALCLSKILSGLKDFRKKFKGKIWLEIMLIKNINDSLEELMSIRKEIKNLSPDKVQLNTVVRPPREKGVEALNLEELNRVKNILGGNCEIIVHTGKMEKIIYSQDIEKDIISLISRRSITLADISNSLGMKSNKLREYLKNLEKKNKIKKIKYKGVTFYKLS
jgi:wyosine [tRNA(Phe)-imidazoG37] synthetase (radical SAM superfamily)